VKVLIYRILDLISRSASFALLFSILFIAQKTVLGWIFGDLKAWGTIGVFYIHELLITAVSIWSIYSFVTISSPWEKYIKNREGK